MPKHLRRMARRDYGIPLHGRDRLEFDVDMLLIQTFHVRDLPDEVVERIFERAQREATFAEGTHRARRRLLMASA